jgi:hypothetical protein
MSFCTNCGGAIPRDAQFCPVCGAPIRLEAQVATPAPIAPGPPSPRLMGSSSLIDRMIRAARLDPALYEEVERDETAMTQALLVVVISSLSAGIGSALSQALAGESVAGIGFGLAVGLFSALVVWFIWAFITNFVGTSFLGGTAEFGELLRTLGFSNAPGALLILSFIPGLGGFLSFTVWIWGLAAMVVAVRQALDFSTGRAILTCIIGWIVAIILLTIIGIVLAIPMVLLGL